MNSCATSVYGIPPTYIVRYSLLKKVCWLLVYLFKNHKQVADDLSLESLSLIAPEFIQV
jgi:hypothetical protein